MIILLPPPTPPSPRSPHSAQNSNPNPDRTPQLHLNRTPQHLPYKIPSPTENAAPEMRRNTEINALSGPGDRKPQSSIAEER
jgi:hypothetical protein